MMSLSAGAKLGRYEIRSKIGEGGMGEAHRAYKHKTPSQEVGSDQTQSSDIARCNV